jgi:multidrug efflux pump subunit AcrA (membrane-fusion protein)
MKKAYLSLILIVLVIGSGILIWQKYHSRFSNPQINVKVIPVAVSSFPVYVMASGVIAKINNKIATINYTLPQSDYGLSKIGQPVIAVTMNGSSKSFITKVNAISSIDKKTKSFAAQVNIDTGDSTVKLLDKYNIKQQVSIHKSKILVPQTAILSTGHASYIFLIKDGRAIKVQVTLGSSFNRFIVVDGKVGAGDSVITTRLHDLSDNAYVRIVQ